MADDRVETTPTGEAPRVQSTLWRDAMRRLMANRLAVVGLVVIALFITVAALAPVIRPYDAVKGFYPERYLKGPSAEHWFGTDDLGRDVLARVVWGARVSLEVGIVAVLIMVILGLVLGAIAGYFGGLLDTIIMRTADVFFAFPYVLGAIAIIVVLGPGLTNVFIAMGVLGWCAIARIFRASILSIKETDYVEAARAMGAGHTRIIARHIFPNAFAPILVYSTMSIGGAIITEAALSFLGLGVRPPQPSWGSMLADSQNYMTTAPWLMWFPGLAILVTVLGFVLLGDGLRDAFDPRMKLE